MFPWMCQVFYSLSIFFQEKIYKCSSIDQIAKKIAALKEFFLKWFLEVNRYRIFSLFPPTCLLLFSWSEKRCFDVVCILVMQLLVLYFRKENIYFVLQSDIMKYRKSVIAIFCVFHWFTVAISHSFVHYKVKTKKIFIYLFQFVSRPCDENLKLIEKISFALVLFFNCLLNFGLFFL